MTELLAPGVYTIETSFRARSIQGVGTSTTGFVGLARTGPVGGPPQLITSYPEFERIYGGLGDLTTKALGGALPLNYLAHAVRAFFGEMGARVYISRAYMANDPAADDGKAGRVWLDAGPLKLSVKSRFAGAGSNGSLTVTEAVSPATPSAIANAPVGSLVRNRGAAATAARLVGVNPPAVVATGSTLSVALNGAAAQVLTIAGTKAVAAAQVAVVVPLAQDTTLVLVADGLRQMIPLTAGLTGPAVETAINAVLQRAKASIVAGVLTLTSDAAGSAVAITVEQNATLGFTDPQTQTAGTGVGRLDRLTAADLNTLIAATAPLAGLQAVAGPGGALALQTTTTGAAARINISATAAGTLQALGLAATNATGTAGVERNLYIRTTTADAGWLRYRRDAGTGRWQTDTVAMNPTPALDSTAYLVLANFQFTNSDGITVGYEDMSLVPDHFRFIGHAMRKAASGEDEPVNDPLVLTAADINGAEIHGQFFAGAASDSNDVLSVTWALTGGNDGTLPALAVWEKALDGLNLYDDISIVAAPGSSAYDAVDRAMRQRLIQHASASGFRIAVLDPPQGQELSELRTTRAEVDSSYAALYAPWIRVANPLARPGNASVSREVLLPPSGHICGIYARNDQLRGVHKTPANEVIRSANGFETEYNQAHQEVLNPIGINCLRTIKGRGARVYGGRLATSDRELVYVSDRRYMNFVKRSIYESMQWAVFEPNGPALWSNVREGVASFLYNQWFNGALFGANTDEAYFVVCDASVMTQADFDNGRMICEIGLALLKPAEFVVFKIGQKTADQRR